MRFNGAHFRLGCATQTPNLLGQTLLWVKDADAYDNHKSQLADKTECVREWKREDSLAPLSYIINSIRIPPKHDLFNQFERLAHRWIPTEAPAEDYETLKPVLSVVTVHKKKAEE